MTVDELVRKGCAERRPHPADARARLVVLTEAGRACTRAAEGAAAEAVHVWSETLGESEVRALGAQLLRIAPNGAIRPAWRALIRSRRVVAGHRRNFLPTRNFPAFPTRP